MCLEKLWMFFPVSFCLRRYDMLNLCDLCNLLMSIQRKTLLYFSTRWTCSRQIFSLWTSRVLDLQQQLWFTSSLVSGLCLLGPLLVRWPMSPPKPYLWSGLLGVAAESTNMNGAACCACCSNNVQWVQFHSYFDELKGVRCHYHQLRTHGYVPTYLLSSPLSI